jgi:acyl carrier protein
MENANLRHELRRFIVQNYLFGQEQEFSDTDSFLEQGIIDSTGVLELVAFLQESYGITVEDEELTPSNLDSLANVSSYLSRKLSSQRQPGSGLVEEHASMELI